MDSQDASDQKPIQYGLPSGTDATERDRLDMQHRLWLLSLHGLTVTKVPPDISTALDIGCGTGSWTVAFAAAHPSCEVIGTDLTPPDIPSAPPNCKFITANAEEEWPFGTKRFDFINARLLTLGIKNWPRLWAQCWDHLKPGGFVELADTRLPVYNYSGATAETSPYLKYLECFLKGAARAGLKFNEAHAEHLERQGFHLVEQRMVDWPWGNWTGTETGKALGDMSKENMRRVTETPVGLKLVKLSGESDDEAQKICSEALRDIDENWRERKWSLRMTVWVAQKPGNA